MQIMLIHFRQVTRWQILVQGQEHAKPVYRLNENNILHVIIQECLQDLAFN